MNTLFCAHETQRHAVDVIQSLEKIGYPTHIIRSGEYAPKGSVVLISIDQNHDDIFHNEYIRMVPFRMNGVVPEWATTTPFIMCLKENPRFPKRFIKAIQTMADEYLKWIPGSSYPLTPWLDVIPEKMKREKELREWLERAKEVTSIEKILVTDVLTAHLRPLYSGGERAMKALNEHKGKIAILICPPFNRWHTDVASTLIHVKVKKVVEGLQRLLKDVESRIQEVTFVVAGDDFTSHKILLESFHQFFNISLDTLSRELHIPIPDNARISCVRGERSVDDMNHALQIGFNLIARDVVAPLQNTLHIPTKLVRWTEFLDITLFEQGYKEVLQREDLALEMYKKFLERGQDAHDVYKFFNQDSWMRRIYANSAFYVGLAYYLKNHPECVLVNTAIHDLFLDGLQPLLESIWGNEVPFIMALPNAYCQPWSE